MHTTRVEDGVLYEAVRSGKLPIVKLLVSRGFRAVHSHRLVELAACKGHLELLQWLVEQNFGDGERYVPLSSTHLDVNKWLVESGLERGVEKTFAEACGKGPLPVVWWLADYVETRGVGLDMFTAEAAMYSAAAQGRLEVVNWLIERDLGTGATWLIHAAAACGHLEVAKYLHAQGFTDCNQHTLKQAAEAGHFAVVQWLWSQFHDDQKADLLCVHDRYRFVTPLLAGEMAAAARNGHLEIVQYLHAIALTLAGKKRKRGESSCYPCKLDMDDVVTEAARSGHLDVVQWVCTTTTVESTKDAMTSAAGNGHFPVVKWLHENRPHEDFQTAMLDAAAGCGDLSLLKWLHTNRPDEGWSTFAVDNAVRGGHLPVLRWLFGHESLYDHDCLVPSNALRLALIGNHFDELLFVHHECKNWSYDITVLEYDNTYAFDEHMREWVREIDDLRESSESD